jgi:hypothetical protein
MKDLVVLHTGDIVYLSSISEDETFDPLNNDLLFFNNGRVRRFKKNGIAYMAIFDQDTNEFDSYRSEINFWNNNKVNKLKTETTASYGTLGDRFSILDVIPRNVNGLNNVILAHEMIYPQSITTEEIETETIYRSIPYNVAHPLRKNITLQSADVILSQYDIITAGTKKIIPLLNPYFNFINDKKYLGVNGQLRDLESYEISILTDVVQVFDWIFSQSVFLSHLTTLKLKEPFNQAINLINRYNHNFGTIDLKYHTLYNDEYFARLRLGLIEFKYWLIQYKDDYTKINTNDLIVYIVNLFDPVELSYLSYETKINLLDKILNDNFWVIGNWGFNKLNDEEAILKIIKCIAREDLNGSLNYSEIDDFIDFLNKIYYSEYNLHQTLYEVLYEKINDTTFLNDDGKGSKGQLVKAVYNLWTESKFNPQHSVPSTAQNALSYFVYTPYNSRWQFDDPTITSPHSEENASPMLINYESEKILVWYVDNFDFRFYKNKILAKIKVEDKGYREYGLYNIFQPIAIKVTNADDTIIRMPAKGISEGGNIIDFIENCFPVFYLQYIDDLGDKSDTKETISTLADVVLTFTGVGNIAKLRHLKDLSLLRKFFVAGELSAIETVALTKALSGLASGFEAIMAIAGLVHRFATASCTIYYNNEQSSPDPNDPEYQKYKLCQTIDIWLFALEMLSLSGDLLARRAFRRATKKLQQSIPSGSEYNELRAGINSLDELDSILNTWLNTIQTSHPNVYTKVNAFTDVEKKFAFMFDFKERPSILDDLNANMSLIDDWSEIRYLSLHRSSTNFLRCYNYIKQDENLLHHIFKGHVYSNGKSYGVHSKIAQDNGDAIITLIDSPNFLGYYEGYVSVKNSTGIFIPKLNRRGTAPGKSTFFKDLWDEQQIIEEISLAYTTKTRVPGTNNQWRGIMSDGNMCALAIDGNTTIFDQTTLIRTAFPIK